tara:strand:+ start:3032 stop:3217 length:186 start_codon:yes stop_codon:yes gene_type:complete
VGDLVTQAALPLRVVGRKNRLQVLGAQMVVLHQEKAEVTGSGLLQIALIVAKEPLNADQMI